MRCAFCGSNFGTWVTRQRVPRPFTPAGRGPAGRTAGAPTPPRRSRAYSHRRWCQSPPPHGLLRSSARSLTITLAVASASPSAVCHLAKSTPRAWQSTASERFGVSTFSRFATVWVSKYSRPGRLKPCRSNCGVQEPQVELDVVTGNDSAGQASADVADHLAERWRLGHRRKPTDEWSVIGADESRPSIVNDTGAVDGHDGNLDDPINVGADAGYLDIDDCEQDIVERAAHRPRIYCPSGGRRNVLTVRADESGGYRLRWLRLVDSSSIASSSACALDFNGSGSTSRSTEPGGTQTFSCPRG